MALAPWHCHWHCQRRHQPEKRCKVASFCIGRSLAPWIIRTRCGPQPEEKAACSLHVEVPGGPTHGWCSLRPKSTHQRAL